MILPHIHQWELDRRNEKNPDDNNDIYKYRHTYICKKCKKKKYEYTKQRMEY